jgi:DNA-binding XRE family transcriptional regulator
MDHENSVKKMREEKMLSKTELARLAGISPLTLNRIEQGKDCRMATKRKILWLWDLRPNKSKLYSTLRCSLF